MLSNNDSLETLLKKLDDAEESIIVEFKELTDAEYDKIRWSMEYAGGRWSEKHKGFKFDVNGSNRESIKNKVKDILKSGKVDFSDEKINRERDAFFPTPLKIVDKMIELANISDGDSVLDSSAGTGRIIHRVIEKHKVYSVALEPNKDRFETLNNGINSRYQTTLERAALCKIQRLEFKGCNKVVINPPFKNDMDVKHLLLNYALCASKADIVCIMQENSLYYNRGVHKILKKFFKLIGKDNYEIIKLPSGSFKEELTTVDTVIVHIKKDEDIENHDMASALVYKNVDKLGVNAKENS